MGKRTIVPFGPQHPALPEPVHLDLELEDETVVRAIPSIGYVHRGLEKLAEKLRYAGSDVSGGSPQDAEIDAALKEIGTMLTAETLGLEAVVGELETALLKREVFLRALRSK